MLTARLCLKSLVSEAYARIAAMPPGCTLADYAASELQSTPRQAPQSAEDFIDWCVRETRRLFDDDRAGRLHEELRRSLAVQTANHLCPSYSAEFLQGDLLFALQAHRVVPILAFGGIPLDNASFPRGMLIASRQRGSYKPFRLPLLSNAWRRRIVSFAPAFRREDMSASIRALSRAPLSVREQETVQAMIAQVHLSAEVLSQATFSDQMCVASARLWECVRGQSGLPPAVVLDIQAAAKALICQDLLCEDSLVARVTLCGRLTRAVYERLNGARACWHDAQGRRQGTFLFWHRSGDSRSTAMRLDPEKNELFTLDDTGFRVRLQAEALLDALGQGTIAPSLYLTFAALALARGVICTGGVFQTGYLPTMLEKTIEAIEATAGSSDPLVAGLNRLRKSGSMSPFMTGMLPLWHENEAGICQPAGALECAAQGLSSDLLAEIKTISVHKAFRAAAAYHYEDLTPQSARAWNWQDLLRQAEPMLI